MTDHDNPLKPIVMTTELVAALAGVTEVLREIRDEIRDEIRAARTEAARADVRRRLDDHERRLVALEQRDRVKQ